MKLTPEALKAIEESINKIVDDDHQLKLRVYRGYWEAILPILAAKIGAHYEPQITELRQKLIELEEEADRLAGKVLASCDRLNSPELREKAYRIIAEHHGEDRACRICKSIVDQILALLGEK